MGRQQSWLLSCWWHTCKVLKPFTIPHYHMVSHLKHPSACQQGPATDPHTHHPDISPSQFLHTKSWTACEKQGKGPPIDMSDYSNPVGTSLITKSSWTLPPVLKIKGTNTMFNVNYLVTTNYSHHEYPHAIISSDVQKKVQNRKATTINTLLPMTYLALNWSPLRFPLHSQIQWAVWNEHAHWLLQNEVLSVHLNNQPC